MARKASIASIFGVSHFSALFVLVGLPLARLAGPLLGAAAAVPASSHQGVWNIRNAGPIP